MAFRKVCTLDDLWQGDMTEVELDGHEILLVWPEEGDVRAYQGVCPHQDIPLSEGKFDGRVIMCRAHQWTFDSTTGNGINPGKCQLATRLCLPMALEAGVVYMPSEPFLPMEVSGCRQLRLNFSHANEVPAEAGMKILATLVRSAV